MDPGVFSRQLLMTVEWFEQNYSSWWLKEQPRLWGIYGGNIPLFRFKENFCGSKNTRTLLPCHSAEVTPLVIFLSFHWINFLLFSHMYIWYMCMHMSTHVCRYPCAWVNTHMWTPEASVGYLPQSLVTLRQRILTSLLWLVHISAYLGISVCLPSVLWL